MPSTPEESSTAPSRRLPKWAKVLIASFVVIGSPVAVALALMAAHFTLTPSFHEYVESAPFDVGELAMPADARILSSDAAWNASETGSPSNAVGTIDEIRHRVVVKHGDETLLELNQVLVYTWNEARTERASFGGRTDVSRTAEGFRAIVRVYVCDSDKLVGPGSLGRGRVDFDVWLIAGEGPDEVTWVAACVPQPSGPGHSTRDSVLAASVGVFHPAPSLPSCGLAHHVRRAVMLTGQYKEGGGGTSSVVPLHHCTTTGEYSYDVESKVTSKENIGGGTSWTEVRRVNKQLQRNVW